jgi:hypothetical protein
MLHPLNLCLNFRVPRLLAITIDLPVVERSGSSCSGSVITRFLPHRLIFIFVFSFFCFRLTKMSSQTVPVAFSTARTARTSISSQLSPEICPARTHPSSASKISFAAAVYESSSDPRVSMAEDTSRNWLQNLQAHNLGNFRLRTTAVGAQF